MDKKHTGNIKPEHQFDLFPKNGLTKQFEPFIRKEVEKYCQSYQHVPRLDMLGEAVRLSLAAEARFKPALGISFATFVAYRLRELQRFAERYDGSQRFRVYEDPKVKAARLAEERGEDPKPVTFKGGGNGPRLRFDWQSVSRCRAVFGMQARAAMDAIGLAHRLQEIREFIPKRTDTRGAGYFRALADHFYRCQLESDSEAEKRAAGDHSPTFLEAEAVTDLQLVGAKKPPRFDPEYAPVLRMQDAVGVGFDDDGNALSWQEVIAAEQKPDTSGPGRIKAIEEARSQMTESETIAADLVIKAVRGRPFRLATLADNLRMTKSGASKVLHRMLAKAGK
jgi:hypothetical protein